MDITVFETWIVELQSVHTKIIQQLFVCSWDLIWSMKAVHTNIPIPESTSILKCERVKLKMIKETM